MPAAPRKADPAGLWAGRHGPGGGNGSAALADRGRRETDACGIGRAICTHGHRNVCCARLGGPLARALARQHGSIWETTHVGGDLYVANMVILPHGLYYGPVTETSARAAITAYGQGEVALSRYRGRTGQPHAVQEAQHAEMTRPGSRQIPPP